jgi:hypothetical protein
MLPHTHITVNVSLIIVYISVCLCLSLSGINAEILFLLLLFDLPKSQFMCTLISTEPVGDVKLYIFRTVCY